VRNKLLLSGALLLSFNVFAQSAPDMAAGTEFVNSLAPASTPTAPLTGMGAFSTPNTDASILTSVQGIKGGLTSLGTSAQEKCASYVPTGDVAQDQYCAAVNFMNNNCITPNAGQSQIIGSTGASSGGGKNCAGSYGAGVSNKFTLSASDTANATSITSAAASSTEGSTCSVQTVETAAASYATYDCTKDSNYTQQTCSQNLVTTITTDKQQANEIYSCSGGAINGHYCVSSTSAATPVIYSCAAGLTLIGSNCINPSGSITPASVASYGCPAGEVLSGSICTKTSTQNKTATSTYTCPDGYVFNNGWCAQTVTSTATPSYSCSSSSTYISNGPTAPPTCQKTYSRFLVGCPSVTQNFMGSGAPAYLIGQPFFGSCTVNWRGQVYYYTNWTCNGTDAQIFLGGYVCQHIDPPTINSYSCTAPAVLSGSDCVTTTTSAATTIYSCNSGGVLSATTCTYTTTSTSAATPNYFCPSGYLLSGTSCIGSSTIAATVSYSCPSGSTISGSGANSLCTTVTTTPALINYSCADGSTPQNGVCLIFSVTSAWQDNCTAYETSAGKMLGEPK